MSYREARRGGAAFIAAAKKSTHVETPWRGFHPARARGKPALFMDCAAMGARRAAQSGIDCGL
jgi:hypothetical protein